PVAGAGTTDTAIGPGAVDSIYVAPAAPTLVVGDSLPLEAVVLNRAGIPFVGPKAAWSSDNPAAVTISSRGVAKAIAVGSANITARIGNKSGSTPVTVAPPPSFVTGADSVGFSAIANGPTPSGKTVAIRHGGGRTLSGVTIDSIQYGAGGSGWNRS